MGRVKWDKISISFFIISIVIYASCGNNFQEELQNNKESYFESKLQSLNNQNQYGDFRISFKETHIYVFGQIKDPIPGALSWSIYEGTSCFVPGHPLLSSMKKNNVNDFQEDLPLSNFNKKTSLKNKIVIIRKNNLPILCGKLAQKKLRS